MSIKRNSVMSYNFITHKGRGRIWWYLSVIRLELISQSLRELVNVDLKVTQGREYIFMVSLHHKEGDHIWNFY